MLMCLWAYIQKYLLWLRLKKKKKKTSPTNILFSFPMLPQSKKDFSLLLKLSRPVIRHFSGDNRISHHFLDTLFFFYFIQVKYKTNSL